MTNSFRFKVDSAQVLKAAGDLEAFDDRNIGRTVQEVVNRKVREFEPKVRAAMVRQILLDDGYVSSKMEFVPANNPNAIRASLVTDGSLVILGHYSPEVTHVATVTGRGKGDPKRGIPAGRKANGVRVTIKRAQPRDLDKAFTMTLRRGNEQGDKTGVFRREGRILKHLYGVAPYSLFRFQLREMGDEFEADLVEETTNAIVDEFGKRV